MPVDRDRSVRSPQAAGPAPRTEPGGTATRLELGEDVWIAPGAIVVGDITLGDRASVWYGCVLRGDLEPIRVGRESNVQDLTLIHVDRGMPAIIGERVTIGHRAVIHGCTVEDEVLIGMGAVLLSGCRVGRGSVVAAGAVVREGFEVPPGTVVAGVPARVRGEVDEAMRARIADGADSYVAAGAEYRAGRSGEGPHSGRTPGRGSR